VEYGKLSYKNGQDFKFFLYYTEFKTGVLFAIRTNINNNKWNKFHSFLDLMMYKYKLDRGIIFKITFNEKRVLGIDFELIEEKWKFDDRKNKKVKDLNLNGMIMIKG
jgi:hypothetical protein